MAVLRERAARLAVRRDVPKATAAAARRFLAGSSRPPLPLSDSLPPLRGVVPPSAAALADCPRRRLSARLAAWRSAGASSHVLTALRDGLRLPWSAAQPLPFNLGQSLRGLTEEQAAFSVKEVQRLFDVGACEPATSNQFVYKAFLVPKKVEPGAPKKWRLVVDFRWVNSYLRRQCCRYETMKRLHHLARPQDWMFSFDIQDGFYAIGVHPADRKYLTMDLAGVGLVQFSALPMGLSCSPFVFTKFMRVFVQACRAPLATLQSTTSTPPSSSACAPGPPAGAPCATPWRAPSLSSRRFLQRAPGLAWSGSAPPPAPCSAPRTLADLLPQWRAVMQKGLRVLPYMDDLLFLTASRAEALAARGYVTALLELLGWLRNPTKGCWEPTQRLSPHLGLGVDSVQGVFFIPPERRDKLQSLALAVLGRAGRNAGLVPLRLLQQFCGTAQSLYLALPPARFMLRSLHDALASVRPWEAQVRLSSAARTDLRWFAAVPERWTARALFRRAETAVLHCDASQLAWSGTLNERLPAKGFWRPHQQPEHITSKELRAVFFTVQSFLPQLQGRRVRLWEDNQAVVAILASWTSRAPLLMRTLRKLWWLMDTNNISLRAEYIRSAANVWADALSREDDPGDWRLDSRAFSLLESAWGPHTVDRFATANNSQLLVYNSKWADPLSAGVDCFAQADWERHNNYCCPPPEELDRLAHLLATRPGISATVVAPRWPAQSWFQVLQECCTEQRPLPEGLRFCPGSLGGSPAGWMAWPLVAFRLEARAS